MTNSEMLSVLVGAFLPFLLALVIRSHWSAQTKSVLAFLACVPVGLATAAVAGALHMSNAGEIETDVLLVMTASYALYNGFYKHQADTLKGLKLPFKIVSANSVAPAPADTAVLTAAAVEASQMVPVEPEQPAAPAS